MKIRKLLWGTLAVTVLWACDPNEPVSTYVNTAPVVKDHSFSAKEDISDTQIIGTVTAKDEVDHDKITFSIRTNDDDLFEISPSGNLSLAQGKHLDFETAEEHTITIMAHDGIVGRYAEVTIAVEDVEPEPDSPTITLNKESLELYTMDTETLTATVTNAEGLEIVWTSDNEEVATVDETGNVTAVEPGTATITAKLGKTTTTCTVMVNPNVYVAGTIINDNNVSVAALWKNGVLQELSDGTTTADARSVFVSGSDVYVTGFVNDANNIAIATLWKNGVAQEFSNGIVDAFPQSIYVDGQDVYVVGSMDYSPRLAVLWKNGVMTELYEGNNESWARSVSVVEGDVYVGGYIYDDNNLPVATLWKNGSKQELSDLNGSSSIVSVFIDGSNGYGAGYSTNASNDRVATYWKNGTAQQFSDGNTDTVIFSIYVKDDIVYACGRTGQFLSTVWIDGTPQYLTDGTHLADGISIAVDRDNIYVAGDDLGTKQVLWVNGTVQNFTDGTKFASGNSVFLK